MRTLNSSFFMPWRTERMIRALAGPIARTYYEPGAKLELTPSK